jgi:uncharacterized UBP type Zn finger protein
MNPDQSRSVDAPATNPNGTAPHCEHLDVLKPVADQPGGCLACQATGDRWATLSVCLTCGWVACGDDSPNRHAKAHYEETDHPLTRSQEPGSPRRWCYVHERLV